MQFANLFREQKYSFALIFLSWKRQIYILTATFNIKFRRSFIIKSCNRYQQKKATLSANASFIEDIFQIFYECLSRPFACHFCLSHFHLPHLPFVGIFNYWGPCVFVRRVPSLSAKMRSLLLSISKRAAHQRPVVSVGARRLILAARTRSFFRDGYALTRSSSPRLNYICASVFFVLTPQLFQVCSAADTADDEPSRASDRRERGSTFSSLCSEG